MNQRAVALAGPANLKGWREKARIDAAHRHASQSDRKRGCPLVIIGRGVVVLTVLAGCMGYAIVNFDPGARRASSLAAQVFSKARSPKIDVSWSPQSSLLDRSESTLLDRSDPSLQEESDADAVAAVSPPSIVDASPTAQVRNTFLNMLQSALASPREVLQFGPMHVKRSIVETIIRAAHDTNTDPVLLMAIADKESSFATGVEARTSSAMGLFQFVDGTWLKVVRDFGAKHGLAKEAAMISNSPDHITITDAAERERVLNLRRDPYLSAVLAAEMLKRDGNRIAQRIGRGLTGGETYIAHFLGPDDAQKFMEKVVGQPRYMAAALLPRPARANSSIFYARAGRRRHSTELSVAAVHDKFEEMMGMRLDRYKSIAAAAGLSAYADVNGQ